MIDFKTFFKNHFDTKKISDDKMRKFASDHVGRLMAKNEGGKYNTMIANTTSAVLGYYGSMAGENVDDATKQSLTITVDNIMDDFKATVRQKEKFINSIWDKNTPQYQKFFPYGITQYTRATKESLAPLFDILIDAATVYAADLPAGFADIFTNFKTSYYNARVAQLQAIGKVSEDKIITSNNRDILEIQLNKNLLTLAIEYLGDEEKGISFFNQSIIRYHEDNDEDYQQIKGNVNPLDTEVIFENCNADYEYIITNNCTVDLIFCCSNNKNTDCATGINVSIGQTITADFVSLGGNESSKYLKVTNNSNNVVGIYEVEIIKK